MSCTCNSPVRPEFKDSYKDLLDKPKINGVTLSGNLTSEDLGIKAGARFKIVTALPTTDIDEATIYIVPIQDERMENIYQEWIYINDNWEKIGEPITIGGVGDCRVSLCPRVVLDMTSVGAEKIDTLDDLRTIFYGTRAEGTPFPFVDNTLYVCSFFSGELGYMSNSLGFTGFAPETTEKEFAVNLQGDISGGIIKYEALRDKFYAGPFIMIRDGKVIFYSTDTYFE